MATHEITDRRFKCDKLTIFTSDTEATELDLRIYMTKHWNAITKGLDNSKILFLCGAHGGKDETLGEKRKIKYLKNQVIMNLWKSELLDN